MTAPLKHSDTTVVDVALGDRAYDIVIGRDVLASLGARVAALRPGARAAIVTD
jgi:3-dehydroquinate synthase